MGTKAEFEATKWFVAMMTEEKNLPATTMCENGTLEEDKFGKDTWLVLPEGERIPMSVRCHHLGCHDRNFTIRRRIEGRPAEWAKLVDDNRDCATLYLQIWMMPEGRHEYILVDLRKMKRAGFFKTGMSNEWSRERVTRDGITTYSGIEVKKMYDAGLVLKCYVFSSPSFNNEALDASSNIVLLTK